MRRYYTLRFRITALLLAASIPLLSRGTPIGWIRTVAGAAPGGVRVCAAESQTPTKVEYIPGSKVLVGSTAAGAVARIPMEAVDFQELLRIVDADETGCVEVSIDNIAGRR